MQGWLKKKGENIGSYFWKDRYFKEVDGKLFYYKGANDEAPKGHIDVSSIKNVKPRPDNFGVSTGFGFEIEVPGRTYCLLASEKSAQLAWVNGLLTKLHKTEQYFIAQDDWVQSLKYVWNDGEFAIFEGVSHRSCIDGYRRFCGKATNNYPSFIHHAGQ